jgi:hypothetical protein
MLQRGRKTAGKIGAVGINPPPLTPPTFLTTDEQALFTEIVDACDVRHFRVQDLPMLSSYVQACFLARTTAKCAADDPEMVTIWVTAVRAQLTLATKLRLTPQTRSDPKTLARKEPYVGPRPWD